MCSPLSKWFRTWRETKLRVGSASSRDGNSVFTDFIVSKLPRTYSMKKLISKKQSKIPVKVNSFQPTKVSTPLQRKVEQRQELQAVEKTIEIGINIPHNDRYQVKEDKRVMNSIQLYTTAHEEASPSQLNSHNSIEDDEEPFFSLTNTPEKSTNYHKHRQRVETIDQMLLSYSEFKANCSNSSTNTCADLDSWNELLNKTACAVRDAKRTRDQLSFELYDIKSMREKAEGLSKDVIQLSTRMKELNRQWKNLDDIINKAVMAGDEIQLIKSRKVDRVLENYRKAQSKRLRSSSSDSSTHSSRSSATLSCFHTSSAKEE